MHKKEALSMHIMRNIYRECRFSIYVLVARIRSIWSCVFLKPFDGASEIFYQLKQSLRSTWLFIRMAYVVKLFCSQCEL